MTDTQIADELAAIDARLRAVPTQLECSAAVNDLLQFMDRNAARILDALRSPEPAQAEPVAWMYELDGEIWTQTEREPYLDVFDVEPTETPLYAAPPASVDRNAVLEEAAKAAYDALHPHPNHPESNWTEYAHANAAAARKAAAAIRALRTEAPAQVEGGE